MLFYVIVYAKCHISLNDCIKVKKKLLYNSSHCELGPHVVTPSFNRCRSFTREGEGERDVSRPIIEAKRERVEHEVHWI